MRAGAASLDHGERVQLSHAPPDQRQLPDDLPQGLPGRRVGDLPPGAALANLMAYLKRSHVTLNLAHTDGNVCVLHRLASEGTEPV
eukprot:8641761-Pyramimonas_sp.AAC.1